MAIGYVCTNYNNSEFTVKAVESLNSASPREFAIVVVDNSSGSDSVRQLQDMASRHENVTLLLNQENVGYFRGLNLGIKHLRARHPEIDWMIIGNNDLEFPPDFAATLAARRGELKSYPVVSPDIVTVEGKHQNPHVIEGVSRLRELVYDLYYANYYLGLAIQKVARLLPRATERGDEREWQTPRHIYQGHGACYLLGPRFFELFSELWAPTFMMSEEYFLSKQLSDVGFQVYYEPAIRVIHHWHGSLEKLPSRKRWNMARDAHREYRKYIKILG